MVSDNFQQRKKAILSKLDKSSIGEWDEKIKSLCEKINAQDNFYTTSSCSGRIIIMLDQDKKSPGLFKFVSHDFVELDELKKELGKINSLQISPRPPTPTKVVNKKAKMLTSYNSKHCDEIQCEANKLNLKFKSEPPILHISCKTLEGAKEILNKARNSGWKRSGIISLGKNIIVELISTEKLEFPLIKKGNLLVDEDFLRIVLEKANNNLKKGWLKIGIFNKNL